MDSHQTTSFFRMERYKYRIPYLFLTLFLIFLLAVILVFVSDYRRFEKKFTDDIAILHNQFEFYINQNEAILEGLSAFIAGAGGINEYMLNRYAEKISSRFPHIYMLEVAEGIKKDNLSTFILQHRKKGDTNFDVKSFDLSEKRKRQKLPLSYQYFPLTYLYPVSKVTQKMLGLDLKTCSFLGAALEKTLNDGGYQTSLPFNLIDGEKAFIMLKKVEPLSVKAEKIYVAVIVVTAGYFILNTKKMDESLGVLIYYSDK